jgi:hypothetical protein
MTIYRLFLTLFLLAASTAISRATPVYVYTLNFGATEVTQQTEVEFLTLSLISGVNYIAPNEITVTQPPFPGAVLRSDVNHFTISMDPGEVVVTIGEPTGTNNLYQFFGLFPAASAPGLYVFKSGILVSVQNPGTQYPIASGFLQITQQNIGGADPVPEPATIGMAGIGLVLLAGGRQWRRRASAGSKA